MKKKNKNKIIKGSLCVILGSLFLSLVFYESKLDRTHIIIADAPQENRIFNVLDKEGVTSFLKNGTGVFLITSSKSEANKYLDLLYDLNGSYKLYMYSVMNDEIALSMDENNQVNVVKKPSKFYNKLLDYLGSYVEEYVLFDNNGEEVNTGYKRIYTPTVLFVKGGKIIYSYALMDDTIEDDELVQLYNDGYEILNEYNL